MRNLILTAAFLVSLIAAPGASATVLEWRNSIETSGWEIFTDPIVLTGAVARRVATREDQDLLFITHPNGISEFARGAGGASFPNFGPTGTEFNQTGVSDVSTDDAHPGPTGVRAQVTFSGNTVEVVDGAVGDIITTEGGHTHGEIAFLQDRYWSIRNGALTAYERGTDPWTKVLNDTLSRPEHGGLPYIDVTMRSQVEDYRVLALTATGIDEYAWDDSAQNLIFVGAYTDLFTHATGISIDGDQDVLYVSTLGGLLQLDRDLRGTGPGGFLSSDITTIDDTRSYLDVDVPRADARPVGQSAVVWAVVGEPEATMLVLLGLLGVIGHRRLFTSP